MVLSEGTLGWEKVRVTTTFTRLRLHQRTKKQLDLELLNQKAGAVVREFSSVLFDLLCFVLYYCINKHTAIALSSLAQHKLG